MQEWRSRLLLQENIELSHWWWREPRPSVKDGTWGARHKIKYSKKQRRRAGVRRRCVRRRVRRRVKISNQRKAVRRAQEEVNCGQTYQGVSAASSIFKYIIIWQRVLFADIPPWVSGVPEWDWVRKANWFWNWGQTNLASVYQQGNFVLRL